MTLYSDITARKQVEEAQEAARRLAEEAVEQKSRFVAIVSHEIRTPLNAVVNSLSLLDRSNLSSAQHRLADTAREAGDALLDLVNDILELSKTEAGQLAMRPTVFDLRPVLEGVQDMFGTEARQRSISLALDVHDNVPERIRGDCGRLRQVIMNFVSNATKFSLPGTVTLRAAAVTVNGCPSLYLSVTDQGPRIPDREAGQLFQPFSRLENARANGAPGTGLGLAICERLTRLMGGTIGVQGAESGGNEFWVVVPLEEIAAPAAELMAGLLPKARMRRVNLLLVEDIPANHLVTATMLRRLGHRVDIAESGPDAIRLVQERPFDLVFMDLIMPGMSGYETARRIRTLPEMARNVPIVALTANTAVEDRSRCIAAGMNDMIGKPLRAAEMVEVLSRTLLPAAGAGPMGAAVAPPPVARPPASMLVPAGPSNPAGPGPTGLDATGLGLTGFGLAGLGPGWVRPGWVRPGWAWVAFRTACMARTPSNRRLNGSLRRRRETSPPRSTWTASPTCNAACPRPRWFR